MPSYKIEAADMERAFAAQKEHFAEGDNLSSMVSDILDKSYYDQAREQRPDQWRFGSCAAQEPMQWIRVDQLPMGDDDNNAYRPKERMQGLFSSMHSLGDKLAFLLVRQDGFTSLYLGVHAPNVGQTASEQLRQMAQLNLPGALFSQVDRREVKSVINGMKNYGVLTGQPSVRWDERENPLQNMDKLAAGFRVSSTGEERDYAVLILAEPVGDEGVKDVLRRVQNLQSELYEYAKWTESTTLSTQTGKGTNMGVGGNLGGSLIMLALTAACVGSGLGVTAVPFIVSAMKSADMAAGDSLLKAMNLGINAHAMRSRSHSTGLNRSISSEHVNYSVKYCISLLDKLVKRMEQGRNLGFWNTGVYILGMDASTVDLVSATLRSVYSGQDSYLEPLRTFNLGSSQEVMGYISNMQLLPLPIAANLRELAEAADGDGNWHLLGSLYEKMSTPVNTEELSIMMSLPKRDVAGLRVKNEAVEFSTNPPDVSHRRTIELGELQNMGAGIGHSMKLDLDQLNSHGLIVGINGSGKSVTSRRLLDGMMEYGVPVMVIDPVKTDYVRWADQYNQAHARDRDFRPIRIYAPGMSAIPGVGTPLSKLYMNPFQPFGAKGAPLNMLEHMGALLALLQKTLAMGDFLPMLLEEAVYNYVEGYFGPDILTGTSFTPRPDQKYPTLSNLQKQVVQLLKDRQYAAENTQNFTAAMQTRINSLTRGWKHDFFERPQSTPAEELFEGNTVVCLAGVTSNSDKAFLMSLLLQALSEYRNSRFLYDDAYRARLNRGREEHGGSFLCHYTVVEEAHRILQVSRNLNPGADPQAAIAEKFSEMLSEIRESGEGLMIVDQYPSRLISDAIKNTNVKLIHKLQARDDIDAMATCMSLNSKQSGIIASLGRGCAIVNAGMDDTSSWVKVYR